MYRGRAHHAGLVLVYRGLVLRVVYRGRAHHAELLLVYRGRVHHTGLVPYCIEVELTMPGYY